MARRRLTAMLAVLIAGPLGACDGGTPPKQATAPVTTVRNDYHERMLALDELLRGAALRRAIRATGASCDRVEASAFQQDHENLKMWTARCQNNDYAVFLAATGDVQVRPCEDAAQLKLPACRALPAKDAATKRSKAG